MNDTQRQNYSPDMAVNAAKNRAKTRKDQQIIELSTGYIARITPVSPSLLNEIQMSVPLPEVPKWVNPDKGKEEENPNDPRYLKELETVEAERVMAAMDGIVLFGVDLVDEDGQPFLYDTDMVWLKKLQYLQRRGSIDLSNYDLKDDADLSFLFKRYIAVSATDLRKVSEMSGLNTEEEVEKAISESFQAN